MSKHFISIVVPVYNEQAAIIPFHTSLIAALSDISDVTYEVIYCDDGSTDDTLDLIRALQTKDTSVRLVALSRNFGKEYALTAGIAQANGEAIMMLDGDGQHPVKSIKDFVAAWQRGAQVVVGVRAKSTHHTMLQRGFSSLFYTLFNRFTDQRLIPGSTDFRLIDREVATAFLELGESNRMTRALIDWLGFKKVSITFTANEREYGNASYSYRQLIRLALNSFVSLSPVPLYFFGYVGVAISGLSAILGIAVFIEQILLRDPMHWQFTGTAMLGILTLFLVGIILMSQGMLSLYVSHIHSQSKGRPLYVIDRSRSVGINKK